MATSAVTSKRLNRWWPGVCLFLVASGCGPGQTPADDTATAKLPPVETGTIAKGDIATAVRPGTDAASPANDSAGALRASTGSSRYVSLEPTSCKLLEENIDEGGYWRRRCSAPAGYALETSESDLRQDIVVIAPDGRRSELNLSSVVARGAFNSLGNVAEWRGPALGKPRALIVRLSVAADADVGRSERSDLVVARLAPPACVVAVVPRGPGQNEKARAIADGELLACKAGPQ